MVINDDGVVGPKLDVEADVDEDEDDCDVGELVIAYITEVISFLLVFYNDQAVR